MKCLGSPLPRTRFPKPFWPLSPPSRTLGPTQAKQMPSDPLRGPRRAQGVISAGTWFHAHQPTPCHSAHASHRHPQASGSDLKAQAAFRDRSKLVLLLTVKEGPLPHPTSSLEGHFSGSLQHPQLSCHSNVRGGGACAQPHLPCPLWPAS